MKLKLSSCGYEEFSNLKICYWENCFLLNEKWPWCWCSYRIKFHYVVSGRLLTWFFRFFWSLNQKTDKLEKLDTKVEIKFTVKAASLSHFISYLRKWHLALLYETPVVPKHCTMETVISLHVIFAGSESWNKRIKDKVMTLTLNPFAFGLQSQFFYWFPLHICLQFF